MMRSKAGAWLHGRIHVIRGSRAERSEGGEGEKKKERRGGAVQTRGRPPAAAARAEGAAARCGGAVQGAVVALVATCVMETEVERIGQGGTMQQERRSIEAR